MRPQLIYKVTSVSFRRRLRHRAVTIVEMLVVIAVSSALLGVVVSLLVSLQQWDRNFRVNSMRREHLLRLADTIRGDIRRATDVSLAEDGTLRIASNAQRQTRYEISPEGCRRTVEDVGETRPSTDLFAIGHTAPFGLEQDVSGRRPLLIVSLSDRREPGAQGLPSPPMLVYAALGADLPATLGLAPKE